MLQSALYHSRKLWNGATTSKIKSLPSEHPVISANIKIQKIGTPTKKQQIKKTAIGNTHTVLTIHFRVFIVIYTKLQQHQCSLHPGLPQIKQSKYPLLLPQSLNITQWGKILI